MKKGEVLFLGLLLLMLVGTPALAGTGGSELTSMWNEISAGLQGVWGKIIAILFVGFALMAGKGGNMLMAFAMFVIAMLIGTIPGIINARFSLTFLGF